MNVLLLTILMMLGALGSALATDTQLITAMDDLWIRHGPIASCATCDAAHLYGPSRNTGTWLISQWGNHAADLLPFKSIACEDGTHTDCWRSWALNQKYYLFTDSNGHRTIRGSSTGQNQPCYPGSGPGGDPYEQDTLISPISSSVYPGYPSGVLSLPNLATLTALTLNYTVKIKNVQMNTSGGCPLFTPAATNQLGLINAITLSNSTSGQTLFYQLSPGRFGFFQSARGMSSTTNPYLWTDNFLSYPTLPGGGTVQGISQALDQPVTLSINMLPVLANVIATGGFGMDPVIGNWALGGMYLGHNTYGSLGIQVEWSNISLVGSQ